MNSEELKEALKGTQYENTNMRYIDKNDEITFECMRCGHCCMNRDDILVSPIDVYNGAKALNITCEEFLEKYCNTFIGGTSGMIVATLASDEKTGWCKLLDFDGKAGAFKCKVHNAKPNICALHPFGIVRSIKADTGEESGPQYVMVDQCPLSMMTGRKMKASEILDHLPATEEEDKISWDLRIGLKDKDARTTTMKNVLALHSTMLVNFADETTVEECGISPRLQAMAKALLTVFNRNFDEYMPLQCDSKMIGDVITAEGNMLAAFEEVNTKLVYTNYDTSKPFMEQAENNLEEFTKYLNMMKQCYDLAIGDLLNEDITEEKKKKVDNFSDTFREDVIKEINNIMA